MMFFPRLNCRSIEGALYAGGKLNKEAFGKIIDQRNFERVKGYLDDALKRGARLVAGGQTESADRTIHPTVLAEVPHDALLMNEEIFGPILPVQTYSSLSQVCEFTQRRGKPLAMYIFGNDRQFNESVIAGTSSGGVTINGWATHWFEPQLPFSPS